MTEPRSHLGPATSVGVLTVARARRCQQAQSVWARAVESAGRSHFAPFCSDTQCGYAVRCVVGGGEQVLQTGSYEHLGNRGRVGEGVGRAPARRRRSLGL